MSNFIHLTPSQDREYSSDVLADWNAGLPFQSQDRQFTVHDRGHLLANGYRYAHVTFAGKCRVLMIAL